MWIRPSFHAINTVERWAGFYLHGSGLVYYSTSVKHFFSYPCAD